MSHPGAISSRCNRTISRIRRRIRLRRTAPPSALLMLQPKRLTPRPLPRKKTVNSRLARRRPSRYTASYSARRTKRHSRGHSNGDTSDAREALAPLFSALCKDFSSAWTLHARAESVLLVAGAHMRLIRAFRHRIFSSGSFLGVSPGLRSGPSRWPRLCLLAAKDREHWLLSSVCTSYVAALGESTSVCDPRGRIKKP